MSRGGIVHSSALAVACCVATTPGCRFFDESLLSTVDAGPADAHVPDAPQPGDAGPSADADAGPPCDLAHPPPRPPGADDGDDAGELVFVLHHFDFDQADDRWRAIGWDLDGLCSDPPEPVVECLAPASDVPEIDGERGIDNAVGHNLFDLLIAGFPGLRDDLRTQEWGHGAIVLRIRGWNGLDDDPRVDVTFTQSIVGTPPLPDGGPPDISGYELRSGDFPTHPNWDGNDWFWVRNSTFIGRDTEQPRIRMDNAYVADRTLVLDLPDRVPITFHGTTRSIAVYLTDAVVAGRIAGDLSGFESVTVGGRWPVSDMLGTLPQAGVCVGSTMYRAMEALTDLAADIRAVPDTGGDGVVCNAVSVGLGAQGTAGRIAGLVDTHDELVNGCELMMMDASVPDGG